MLLFREILSKYDEMKPFFVRVRLNPDHPESLFQIPFIINPVTFQVCNCIRNAVDFLFMDVESDGTDPAAERQVSLTPGIALRFPDQFPQLMLQFKFAVVAKTAAFQLQRAVSDQFTS